MISSYLTGNQALMRIPNFKRSKNLLRIHLARQYAKLYSKDLFIGVSGSINRTICVQAAVAVLSQKYNTIQKSNPDSLTSIPLTLLKLTPKVKKVILDLGIEYSGEMDFYLSLIKPKTIILTDISLVNCEYIDGLEEIIAEESKLVRQLSQQGVAILNFDDPSCKETAKDCQGLVVYFGTDPKNCNVWAGNIKIEDYKTTFELNLGVERVKVNFPLLGLHHIYPALAAAALGAVNNISLTKIKIGLESFQPLEHQMQILTGPNGSIILDDTYSNAPAEVEALIDTLMQISARRRVLVLGEMINLGKYSERLHRQIAQKIFKEKIDMIFLGQGNTQIIADELKSLGFLEERLTTNLQNSQIVSKLLKTLGKGDVVLIKGASNVRLDEVVKRIVKR